jgi:hypothetical protein
VKYGPRRRGVDRAVQRGVFLQRLLGEYEISALYQHFSAKRRICPKFTLAAAAFNGFLGEIGGISTSH